MELIKTDATETRQSCLKYRNNSQRKQDNTVLTKAKKKKLEQKKFDLRIR